jgi:L,D-transpeptidase-like protein
VTVRRALLLAAAIAAIAAAPAHAADPVIENDVTVSGVDVGGMTEDEATAAVQAFFDRPMRFIFRGREWQAGNGRLGATGGVANAVQAALDANAGDAVTLGVSVKWASVKAYAAYLDRRFSRRMKNARLVGLRNLRPRITKGRSGIKVRRLPMAVAILKAYRRHGRGALGLRVRIIQQRVTRARFGPVVVIRRDSKGLYLYKGVRFQRRFGVATGQAAYPTPLGRFRIVVKERNPWWNPPNAGWASGAQPIPPGPGNPLGTRWMGLSVGAVGIHGTPDASSIGYSASHGCIRMHIPEAEYLFRRVRIGTPVFIVGA